MRDGGTKTMRTPEFPGSRNLVIDDKPLFDSAFAARPPELSAYSFTNIFAWREAYGLRVSALGESLIVSREQDGKTLCFEPIGPADPVPAIEEALSLGRDIRVPAQGAGVEFIRLHEATAAAFRDRPGFEVSFDRDNSDYLYLASDLIELPGRRFDAKRNFVNRFRSAYSYDYVVMTEETAEECREFADMWCEERSCETVEGLAKERCAVHEMLVNFAALELVGGAIRIDGAIVAFSLGEALNPQTLVVHVEKADSRFDGLYQLINNEFCAREARGFTYVNREQDLGVPGLRKAKDSYQPVRMVGAWNVGPSAE